MSDQDTGSVENYHSNRLELGADIYTPELSNQQLLKYPETIRELAWDRGDEGELWLNNR
jgi:hypothetical protein